MKKLIFISLIFIGICINTSGQGIKDLPDIWVHLTKTDSGFVHESHNDLGGMFLQILDSNHVRLISDQSTIEIFIENYDYLKPDSLSCSGKIEFGGRLEGEESITGSMKFKWIDKKTEIGVWTIDLTGIVTIKEYFSSKRKFKDYPVIITGNE